MAKFKTYFFYQFGAQNITKLFIYCKSGIFRVGLVFTKYCDLLTDQFHKYTKKNITSTCNHVTGCIERRICEKIFDRELSCMYIWFNCCLSYSWCFKLKEHENLFLFIVLLKKKHLKLLILAFCMAPMQSRTFNNRFKRLLPVYHVTHTLKVFEKI